MQASLRAAAIDADAAAFAAADAAWEADAAAAAAIAAADDVQSASDGAPTSADHPDFLPGMAPERIDELESAATNYEVLKMKRVVASVEEREAKQLLLERMIKHAKTRYVTVEGIVANRTEKYNVKTSHDSGRVTVHGFGDREPPDDDDLDIDDDIDDDSDDE